MPNISWTQLVASLAFIALTVAAVPAFAGQCMQPGSSEDEARRDAEAVSRAEMVFVGRVVGQNLAADNAPGDFRRTVTFEVLSAEKGQASGDVRLWFFEVEGELSFPPWRFQLEETYRVFVHRSTDVLFFSIGCGPSRRIRDAPGELEATGGCASCTAVGLKGRTNLLGWLVFVFVVVRRRNPCEGCQ